jgi:hypothetical protein
VRDCSATRLKPTRYSKPLAGDTWWHHPKAPHPLEPASASASHPYPVEIDLPRWTVERDMDQRKWLFGLGHGIRIEALAEPRVEYQCWLCRSLDVYGS